MEEPRVKLHLLYIVLLVAPPVRFTAQASKPNSTCVTCHEIQPAYDLWSMSTHRKIACGSCHGGSFSANNVTRLYEHVRGKLPEQIHVRSQDIPAMLARCQSCHRQEFADWQAGPHGVNYAKIFTDKEYNRTHPIRDDCLRCHGAHFQGGIRELTPRLQDAAFRAQPAIPCLSCHQVHREGKPLDPPQGQLKPPPEVMRPSVALYDRRTMLHVAAADLPLPKMLDGPRAVKMSPDTRQGLCYQCHAPTAQMQVKSGDDRTSIGVHEGISCLGCHQKHGQQARASCATCHPRLSNCGFDVEKMDTTFLNLKSSHNVHFVKCEDCHTKGVPRRRATPAASLTSAAGSGR